MRSHEVQGIMRLSQAYINIERSLIRTRQEAARSGGKAATLRKTVAMTDTDGLKALFAGKGSRPRPAALKPPSKD